jgi:hypothetical protein
MEQELRRALRRAEPSAGFADRVVAALARPRPEPDERTAWSRARWIMLGLAASVAIASAAGWMQSTRRAEAERARQDVELALRITSQKLQLVQSKVQERVVSYRERFFQREQS